MPEMSLLFGDNSVHNGSLQRMCGKCQKETPIDKLKYIIRKIDEDDDKYD